ncbi:CaiB/BaiF CoA transferase family protein [Zavarzinia compransoris]|uniref:CoA transferase n=1 Tax=Zavarzinia compransoris TaxID=1264899 RepID=A0A317E8P8_9PROT|nr:CaiB/BaiF CoA-transferase family protein [Zavarzinia compransoris]PWR23269.1 CoA transferase [Zavarzinia compransoris]TDP46164.1 crotonobetainyl-CoA:carnitine CoA-transferase CaiB-like acyl-CoA transferase [Zavarzinia compransoris]
MAGAPHEGLRVIELARILAGPWAGQILADLGADVIKIEKPGAGDDTRSWGPPFLPGPDGGTLGAAYFHGCNRGKRSVAVDIATPAGQAAIRDLVRGADVLIENFKVGGLARYGLDYQSLSALNPRLVYCSITGFGQDGPYARRAGYDLMIQGLGGIMDLTGEADGPPQRVGIPLVDLFTGVYAVVAIQAALAEREKSGLGQHVDMALLDTQVAILGNHSIAYLATGNTPRRYGNAHPSIVPYQSFACADGHLILAVGNDGQFRKAAAVLGLAGLGTDPRFATNEDRVRHRETLIPLMAARMAEIPRDTLLAGFEAAGVPAGPINTVAQVFADPQVRHRGMQLELDSGGMPVPGVRTPIRLSRSDLVLDRPSPSLGQHTEEVLAGLALPPDAN